MTGETGHIKLLRQLCADGVTHLFGNPGTSEEGILDALRLFPEITYVQCLQESVAVAMADGYARATQRPAVVQLHSGVGLGNGIGMIYQAMRGHTPLLVFAGEAGLRYENLDAQMACDLVAMAAPVCKYATRVTDPRSVLRVMRRAYKIAATAPTGPVFVALPQDLLDQTNSEEVRPTLVPSTRVQPDPEALRQAAALLAGSRHPIVLMGDGIARAQAVEELVRVSELLGAEVYGVNSSEVNFPASHPLYCGTTGHMFGATSRALVAEADAVLVCGTYLFPEVFPDLGNPFRSNARILHIEPDPYEIAKNLPVDLAFVADPMLTLGALAALLECTLTPGQQQAARERREAIGERNRQALAQAKAADAAQPPTGPATMARFARELAERVGEDLLLFDEALTASPELLRYLPPDRPGSFFQTRGGSLGVGIPGALGLKLAHPDKPAIAVTGDGGAMYTIQALATARAAGIAAKFVVCSNGGYKLLKLNIQAYWREQGEAPHPFPPLFDIGPPTLAYAEIARGFGIAAERVESGEAIAGAIDRMLAHDGPYLIELVIPATVAGEVPHCCGQ